MHPLRFRAPLRRARLVFVPALTVCLGRTDAAAQEVPPQAGPAVRRATEAEALQQDARAYAEQFKVPPGEAVRRLRAEARQGDVVGRLRAANRGRFAGLWVEHQPEFRVVVRLKGDTPPGPEFRTASAGSAIRVAFVTGASATEDEVMGRIQSSLPQFRAALPELMATDMDVRTGDVVLFVHAQGAAGEAAQRQADVLARQIGHPVRVRLLDSREQEADTRGGANLSTCTSGFVVPNGAGTRGVLTAAHCGNTQTYSEFGGTTYAMTFVSESLDADADVQWHTTASTEVPEFYADLTTTARVLTGRRLRSSTAVGNTVCHRGKTTGYSCGSVASITHQPAYTNACGGVTCSALFIRVEGPDLRCYGGDSGGPFFNGQTAFGIHKSVVASGTGTGQCTYAVYMSTDYISDLGVSLVYGP